MLRCLVILIINRFWILCFKHLVDKGLWHWGFSSFRWHAPGSKHAAAPKRAVAETSFGQIPCETQNISPLCCRSEAVGQWVGMVRCIGHCFQCLRCGFDWPVKFVKNFFWRTNFCDSFCVFDVDFGFIFASCWTCLFFCIHLLCVFKHGWTSKPTGFIMLCTTQTVETKPVYVSQKKIPKDLFSLWWKRSGFITKTLFNKHYFFYKTIPTTVCGKFPCCMGQVLWWNLLVFITFGIACSEIYFVTWLPLVATRFAMKSQKNWVRQRKLHSYLPVTLEMLLPEAIYFEFSICEGTGPEPSQNQMVSIQTIRKPNGVDPNHQKTRCCRSKPSGNQTVAIRTIRKQNVVDPNHHKIKRWRSKPSQNQTVTIQTIRKFFLERSDHSQFFVGTSSCQELPATFSKSKGMSSRFFWFFFLQHAAACQVQLPRRNLCVSDGSTYSLIAAVSSKQIAWNQFTSKKSISDLKRVSTRFVSMHLSLYVKMFAGRYRDWDCSDALLSGFEALSSKLFGPKCRLQSGNRIVLPVDPPRKGKKLSLEQFLSQQMSAPLTPLPLSRFLMTGWSCDACRVFRLWFVLNSPLSQAQ